MEQEHAAEASKIKLLLLGAGESGKSTIFKQMKVIYGEPLSQEELKHYTQIVYSNTLVFIKAICTALESFGLKMELEPFQQEAFDALQDCGEFDTITPELGHYIKALWDSEIVHQAWSRRCEYQIVDSHKAYLDDIERIADSDYLATQQDVLLCRVRTSGIVTERYIIDGTPFEMYDVGGQRNERKKWIHCFDGVTAIIFVAAISEYDQTLYEDSKTNRMSEAIHLFEDICNNKFFEQSSMILFLNKRDLFFEKIREFPIQSVPDFSDYRGEAGDFDAGCNYFLQKFLSMNQNPEREVYSHITCATDTANVQFVWNSCKDIILRNNLKDSGFM